MSRRLVEFDEGDARLGEVALGPAHRLPLLKIATWEAEMLVLVGPGLGGSYRALSIASKTVV